MFKKASELLQKKLEEVERYQHPKTPGFKPPFLDDEEYLEDLRSKVSQVVYANWFQYRIPSHITKRQSKNGKTVQPVFLDVQDKVKKDPAWQNRSFPSKRTIDRRVNECADPKHWEQPKYTGPGTFSMPPLIGIGAAYYLPNPERYDLVLREELYRAIKELEEVEKNGRSNPLPTG